MKKNLIIFVVIFFALSTDLLADQANYLIGPGDKLEISVWRDESLSRQLKVPPDGVISFPLIGEININDITVSDLRQIVKVRLSEFVPDATVSVILLESNRKAYVIGKVNKAGEFFIGMDTNAMQLLSLAGGINPFAAEDRIHILRRVNDKTIKIPLNYSKILKGENLETNILLQSGDIIVVP